MANFLDKAGLSYVISKLKTYFDKNYDEKYATKSQITKFISLTDKGEFDSEITLPAMAVNEVVVLKSSTGEPYNVNLPSGGRYFCIYEHNTASIHLNIKCGGSLIQVGPGAFVLRIS